MLSVMLWQISAVIALFLISPQGLLAADSAHGLEVQDIWGRSLNKVGVTLVDWEGYLANPAVRLTLRPPADAVFPVTFHLAADGPRLYFDDQGSRSRVGAEGPRKDVLAADKGSRPAVYLVIFPDRDDKHEDYTLTVTCTDSKRSEQTLHVPIHVIDQDRKPSASQPFKITVDFSQDQTGFFKDARARAIVQQAADDWAYFFDGTDFDPVPANEEATLIWSRKGFVSPTTVHNATGYTGFLLYAYGIESPELRSGGEGSRQGGFQSAKGKTLDLRRSGGLEVEVRGNYNRLGWFYTASDDDWWKSANLRNEPNDLYSIVHHEIGHALIFNPAYPRFARFKQAGAADDAAVRAWLGAAAKIDRADHLVGTVDPASRRGAFGYEYHGDMPQRRWLITKSDLLVAQAIGYRLRKTSAFEPLTVRRFRGGEAPAEPHPPAREEDRPPAKADQELKGRVGRPCRVAIDIRGGLPPYYCSLAEGNLPPGLALDSFTGEVAGVPTEAGVFVVAVQVRDDPKSKGVRVPLRIEISK
jgi:hypothetical protein